jgi:DNA-binding transcriptional ArsR family regulator
MSTENFKQDVYLQLARVAKAVGHANRLELLEFVAQGPRGVDELAAMTRLSVANASKHLQELRQAGLVKARKEGVRVFYEVAGSDVVDLLGALRVVAESRVAEVSQLLRTYITSRDELEPVPAKELMQRAKQGLVTVLDVRPAGGICGRPCARRNQCHARRPVQPPQAATQGARGHRLLSRPLLPALG